jgi:hypothetical protein
LNFEYDLISETYKSENESSPPFQKEMTAVSLFFIQAAFVTPLMVLIIFMRNPDAPYFPTSLFLTNVRSYPLWARFLLALPTVWLFLANWACLLCYTLMGLTPIYASIFLISELW